MGRPRRAYPIGGGRRESGASHPLTCAYPGTRRSATGCARRRRPGGRCGRADPDPAPATGRPRQRAGRDRQGKGHVGDYPGGQGGDRAAISSRRARVAAVSGTPGGGQPRPRITPSSTAITTPESTGQAAKLAIAASRAARRSPGVSRPDSATARTSVGSSHRTRRRPPRRGRSGPGWRGVMAGVPSVGGGPALRTAVRTPPDSPRGGSPPARPAGDRRPGRPTGGTT